MKILMLTPYLPYPPSSGGQVRSYNLIKNLAGSHEITLFSLIKKPEEKNHVAELAKYCRQVKVFRRPPKPWTWQNVIRTGFSLYPFLVIRNFSKEAREALAYELRTGNYDLIHAETFYVMPHLPPTSTPVLLVDQTIEFQVYEHYVRESKNRLLKPLLYLDVAKIKYWEAHFWKRANKVVAVSEADKQKMQSFVKDLDVGVVPNGAGEDLMNVWQKRRPAKNPIFFFQANFTWLQNTEAAEKLAREIFPLIKKKIKAAECWIVGQEARGKISHLKKEGVTVVDLANTDIAGVVDAYRRASIFLAPLEGPGGTRLKILAAMAAGIPVVSSRVGIEGIDAVDGREVLIADRPADMAVAAAGLINNQKQYRQIVAAARKLVEEKYSYQSIAKLLENFYREVAFGAKN